MAYTTIDDPSAHFQTTLYTGNGSSGHAITNGGNSDLQPDWIWIKKRDTADHNSFDSSRGASKHMAQNASAQAEQDVSGVTAFNSDGFTLGTNGDSNYNTGSFVAWQWKANGGTRTTFTESGNNMGGGYQANATAGFSIIDYVGTGSAGYFSHGLGAAPEFIIAVNRSTAGGWRVWSHKLSGVTYRLYLHGTNAESSGWDSWTIGSSTVTLGTDGSVNKDGDNHIAYCFRSIQGYSKFGKYTGNGSTNGPFIYTGFKPAFTITKKSSDAGEWFGFDNKRNTYNPTDTRLELNDTSAEGTSSTRLIDALANGFKIKGTNGAINGNGATYIYASFAHQPFVTSGGVPCTAF